MTQLTAGQGPTLFPRSRRRSRFVAVVFVVGLWVASLAQISADNHRDRAVLAVLALAVVVPLFWRRRAPMMVFGLSAAAAAIQWGLSEPLFSDLALLVAFYTVAATQSRRRTLIAAALLEFAVAAAAARYGAGGDSGRGYAVVVILLSGLVVAAGVLGLNVKVRAAYLGEVEARAARAEYERDQQGLLAAAAERTRIAREMHDIVAHNLSVMIALNDGASFTMQTDPAKATEAVREASKVGRTALRELQRTLGVLRDRPEAQASRAPAPTIAALDELLVPIRRTGLDVALTIEGQVADLSPGLQLTVFRLVQESLTNTVKHAVDADEASVAISCTPTGLEVTIADNGRKPEAASPDPSPGMGHGIIGMHERAASHGGKVQTGWTAGGWMVSARFPVENPSLTDTEPLEVGALR